MDCDPPGANDTASFLRSRRTSSAVPTSRRGSPHCMKESLQPADRFHVLRSPWVRRRDTRTPMPRRSGREGGRCTSGCRGQRISGLARRPVVLVPVPSGCCAGDVPPPDEVRSHGLAPRFCRLQDAPTACQQVQRVFSFGSPPGPGRA